MPDLGVIRGQLAAYAPARTALSDRPPAEAAVALVLHQPPGSFPELLFIERARRAGDPWSGQMAFPGGRRQREDRDLVATAARETLEETGVALETPIGQLDELRGSRRAEIQPFVLAPYVFELARRPEIAPNHEVSAAVWVPLDWILHPDSAAEYRLQTPAGSQTFPAFRYERFTVWGLTYRVLANFFAVLGRGLPSHERW